MSPQQQTFPAGKTVGGPLSCKNGQPRRAFGDDHDPEPEADAEDTLGPCALAAPFFVCNTFLESERSRPPSIEGLQQFDYPPDPAGKEAADLSRSTSDGSQGSVDSAEGSPERGSPRYVGGRVYDGPLFVRNTFVDYPAQRPPSLEGFFQERQVQSCPTSRPISMEGSGVDGGCDAAAAAVATASGLGTPDAWSAIGQWLSPQTWEGAADGLAAWERPHAAANETPVVWPAHAIAEPQLGTPELPTMGSAGHLVGCCKPCAFVHVKGCESGVMCTFCHLCPPGEKQRRRKDKAASKRAWPMQQMHYQMPAGLGQDICSL